MGKIATNQKPACHKHAADDDQQANGGSSVILMEDPGTMERIDTLLFYDVAYVLVTCRAQD